MATTDLERRMERLSAAGFTTAVPTSIRRLVVSASGRTATGKTKFALSAPGPIAYLELDLGGLEGPLEGSGRTDVMRKIIQLDPEKSLSADLSNLDGKVDGMGRTVKAGGFGAGSPTASLEVKAAAREAVEKWRELKQFFIAAVKGGARTVVLDQSTDAWRLCRMAYFLPEFGRTGRIEPIHYEPPKHDFMTLIDLVKATTDVNLILIHKEKDEYQGKEKVTGGYQVSGPPEVEHACNVCLRMTKEAKVRGLEKFGGEIVKCRQNTMLEGMELPSRGMKLDGDGVPVVDDDGEPVEEDFGLDFPSLAELVTGVGKGQWK